MTNEQILARKKNRLQILESNGKNIKSGGVVKRLRREIRNLEKQSSLVLVAQLVKHLTFNQDSVGSNPIEHIFYFSGMAQFGRALRLGRRSRGFKSFCPNRE